jgi:hypothetical protein
MSRLGERILLGVENRWKTELALVYMNGMIEMCYDTVRSSQILELLILQPLLGVN